MKIANKKELCLWITVNHIFGDGAMFELHDYISLYDNWYVSLVNTFQTLFLEKRGLSG